MITRSRRPYIFAPMFRPAPVRTQSPAASDEAVHTADSADELKTVIVDTLSLLSKNIDELVKSVKDTREKVEDLSTRQNKAELVLAGYKSRIGRVHSELSNLKASLDADKENLNAARTEALKKENPKTADSEAEKKAAEEKAAHNTAAAGLIVFEANTGSQTSDGVNNNTGDSNASTADAVAQAADSRTSSADTVTQAADPEASTADAVAQAADSRTSSADTVTQAADPEASSADAVAQAADSGAKSAVEAGNPARYRPIMPGTGFAIITPEYLKNLKRDKSPAVNY